VVYECRNNKLRRQSFTKEGCSLGTDKSSNEFDPREAELFEALGHPTRIGILQMLNENPLGFSELKKKIGIDSSGHLTFHLSKLVGLVRTNPEGKYYLTDIGREALRVTRIAGEALDISENKDRDTRVPSFIIMAMGFNIAGFVPLALGNLSTAVSSFTVSLIFLFVSLFYSTKQYRQMRKWSLNKEHHGTPQRT
jgi:DNA-binding transcriptional ArsR family regulator